MGNARDYAKGILYVLSCFGLVRNPQTTKEPIKYQQMDQVCNSQECVRSALWYKHYMTTDTKIRACDDFYEYVCGNSPNVLKTFPKRKFNLSYFVRELLINEKILDFFDRMDDENTSSVFFNIRSFYKTCVREGNEEGKFYDALKVKLREVKMFLAPPFLSSDQLKKNYAVSLANIRKTNAASKILFSIDVTSYYLETWHLLTETIRSWPGESIEYDISRGETVQLRRTHWTKFVRNVVKNLYQYYGFTVNNTMERKIKEQVKLLGNFFHELYEVQDRIKEKNLSAGTSLSMKEVKEMVNDSLQGGQIQIDFIQYMERLFASNNIQVPKMMYDSADTFLLQINNIDQFKETLKILQKTNTSVFEFAIWWTVVWNTLAEKEGGPGMLRHYYNEYIVSTSKTISSGPSNSKKNWNTYSSTDLRSFMIEKLGINYQEDKYSVRIKYCLDDVRKIFGDFAAYVLIRNTPNLEKKMKKITEIFENIRQTYKRIIERTEKIENIKELIIRKLETIRLRYISFDDLTINRRTIEKKYKQIFITDNYNFTKNFLPDPQEDKILHYGSIGFALAHEIGHIFDPKLYPDNEDTFDKNEDYREMRECFVEFFNKISVKTAENEFNVDGNLTAKENIADWQGLKIAEMAYERHVQKHGSESKLTMFTELAPSQLFYLVYANFFCTNKNTWNFEAMLKDEHAPSPARVNGALQNQKKFSDAWACDKSTPMNPEIKCEIWT